MQIERTLSAEYIAGFFDGEGSITLAKRQTKSGPVYLLVVCVVNTHLPLIAELQRMFQGSNSKKALYRNEQYGNVKYLDPRQKCYTLHMASEVAERFLRVVYPHLIIKREQAELAFSFREHIERYRHDHKRYGVKSWRKSPQYALIQQEREAMYLKMKALKRVDFAVSDGIAVNSGEVQNGQSRAKQVAVTATGRV